MALALLLNSREIEVKVLEVFAARVLVAAAAVRVGLAEHDARNVHFLAARHLTPVLRVADLLLRHDPVDFCEKTFCFMC